jgi:hypothetical protein
MHISNLNQLDNLQTKFMIAIMRYSFCNAND